MKRFLIALQFLTILPIKIKSEIKEADFGRSLLYFPVVGLITGFLLSVTAFSLGFLPDLLKGVFILMVSVIITGAVHLDGFADTCDGFYGSKPKEKVLEIMRDSRIGVMGVIGIVSLLLLKFTLIVSIPQNLLWKSLIMMTAFSRWSQALACYTAQYARKEGKAIFFIKYANRKDVIMGGVFAFLLFLLIAKLKGVVIFILSFLSALLFIQYVKRKIGGMTGDTIGATSEISEVVVLLFVLIVLEGKI
jgi:adenosylcobinamide-GDP ribazoletransferase